jgi:hypothetical protein
VSRATRLIAIFTWAVLARSAFGQDSTNLHTAAVTYVTSASVYIDAGREAGLREGAQVQVIRAGVVIATLKASFLSSHQSSCEIVRQSTPIVVGDSVRFTPVAPRVDSTTAVSLRSSPRTPRSRSSLRGRIGAHYLIVGSDAGGGFTQPSLDVYIDGRPTSQAPLAVAIDIRARRTASTLSAGTAVANQARAYQLALSWSPPTSPTRFTLGRQIALGFASVGLYDGVSVELNNRRWSGALFTGTQPNPVTLDFATDVLEAGGYIQRHGRGQGGQLWSATVGLSGSYQNGHTNREFALLQGSYSTRRIAVFASQEIDYYRPWKRTSGTPAVSFTSTFATVRYRATDGMDLQAGFDNRRSVLLYRDVVNPVTTFDDAFRQGVWAGMYLRFARRFLIGLDARRSSGGAAGTAGAVTATFGADRLAGTMVGLRTRTTYYHSPALDGWLQSASLAAYPGIMHIELSGGLRNERERFALANSTITWVAGDLDVSLGRVWYLMVSGTVERGPERTSQLYGGFNVRF